MTVAGLLHGLARVASHQPGGEWTKDVCLCLATSEHKLRQLELQCQAKVVFGILCSCSH